MNASRTPASATATSSTTSRPRRIAVIGAGIAGLACARTLLQAGHEVHVYERLTQAGGRMRSVSGPYGSFDIGAQFFTVRDPRFQKVLDTTPGNLRLHYAWQGAAHRTPGRALQWWLEQLESPTTRKALMENHHRQ